VRAVVHALDGRRYEGIVDAKEVEEICQEFGWVGLNLFVKKDLDLFSAIAGKYTLQMPGIKADRDEVVGAVACLLKCHVAKEGAEVMECRDSPVHRIAQNHEELRLGNDIGHSQDGALEVQVVGRHFAYEPPGRGGAEVRAVPGQSLVVMLIEEVDFLAAGKVELRMFPKTLVSPGRGGSLGADAKKVRQYHGA
jgi:hypothetical protein